MGAERPRPERLRPPLGELVHHGWRPAADDPLAPFVESVVDCEGRVLHAHERVLPSGALDLVLHLDEPYRAMTARGGDPFPTACVSSLLAGSLVMAPPTGAARIVGVRLRPAGARTLLGRPLSELGGRTVDLHDLLPRAAVVELVERCGESRSGAQRVEIARRWLARQLAGRDRRDAAVAWAASRIERCHGAVDIDALRRRTGRSWARLAADFRDQVGVTPKRYARLVRFRRAVALLHESPSRALASLALDAGYYDQAHMTADFRALADITPGALRSAMRYPEAVSVAEPVR